MLGDALSAYKSEIGRHMKKTGNLNARTDYQNDWLDTLGLTYIMGQRLTLEKRTQRERATVCSRASS